MAPGGEDPGGMLSAVYVGAKHALRSFGYGCARITHLPFYRYATPLIPLPGGIERVYFYHVRKTGGTTLAHAFLALGGEDPGRVEWRMKNPPFCTYSRPYRFAYQDPPLLRRGYFFFGYGHMPAETIRLPDRTFTVTILRDPVDRIVSLYRYLADPQADEGHAFHSLGYEREWARAGFGRFLDRVSQEQLLNQLLTFSTSGNVQQAAERILGCDRVLLTEDLDHGIEELAAFLELPLKTRRVRQSTFDYQPSGGEIARLQKMLEPEYQLLSLVTSSVPGRSSRAHRSPVQDPSVRRQVM